MGKNSKAKKEALAAAKAAKTNNAGNTVKEKKETVDTTGVNNKEKAKEGDEKPAAQTNKPAAPAAAPNPPAPATSKEDKGNNTGKGKEKPKPKKEVPVVEAEEVVHGEKKEEEGIAKTALQHGFQAANVPIGSTSCSFDGKTNLLYVMQKRYGENPEFQKQFPESWNALANCMDVVVVLSLLDVQKDLQEMNNDPNSRIKLAIPADQLMQVKDIADKLGISVSTAPALPAPDGESDANREERQKQLEIVFNDLPENANKGTQATFAKEKAKVEPVLDFDKVTDDDTLKNTLNHLLTSEKNPAKDLVNTVEWFREYSIRKAANTDQALALDDLTVQDWINRIFEITLPTVIIKGLGHTIYGYTSQTGSPVMAHAILHRHFNKLGWNEEQIASVVRTLLQANFDYEAKEDDKRTPETDKALIALITTRGVDYINNLISADAKDPDIDNIRKIRGSVKSAYWEANTQVSNEELRMRVGQILNLYRDPATRLAEFEASDCYSGDNAAEKKN